MGATAMGATALEAASGESRVRSKWWLASSVTEMRERVHELFGTEQIDDVELQRLVMMFGIWQRYGQSSETAGSQVSCCNCYLVLYTAVAQGIPTW